MAVPAPVSLCEKKQLQLPTSFARVKKGWCCGVVALITGKKIKRYNTTDFTEDHSVHYYLGANELDYAGLMGSGTFSLL